MSKLTNLKDKQGNVLYPLTKTNAVSDNNGVSLDSLLSTINQSVSDIQSRVSTLENEREHYATYTITSAVSSFRFQIADAGEFANYKYEFVFKGIRMSDITSLYLMFGDSSSDLNTSGANSRLHAYWSSGSSGNGTVSSYQSASPNYALYYNRVANSDFEGNVNLTPSHGWIGWNTLLGRSTNGDIEYRLGWTNADLAAITHARVYPGSGTLSEGEIYVFRTKKI